MSKSETPETTYKFRLENHLDNLELVHSMSVKILHQKTFTMDEWRDDLIHNVHLVCLCDGSDKMWKTLKDDILSTIAIIKSRISNQSEPQLIVKSYIREWDDFFASSDRLRMAFSPMQKILLQNETDIYISTRQSSKIQPDKVPTFMMENWKLIILNDIQNNFRKCVMELIENERNGRESDVQLVMSVRKSYLNLSTNLRTNKTDELAIYRECFLTDYIESTRDFYRTKLSEYLTINGVENYIKHAIFKLREEEKRGKRYLNSDEKSVEELLKIWPEIFVEPFTEPILAECANMIARNNIESLQSMYELMCFTPSGLLEMCTQLEEYILRVGLADMLAEASTIVEDSVKYVQQLIDLFNRFSELVKDAFFNDPRFLSSRDKAFQNIVNDTTIFKLELVSKNKTQAESKCPELLAHFCDILLRKTQLSKKCTSADIDEKLKDALLLLKYVDNKDVFMRYYKSHLTRRLILDTSADREKEGEMALWLKGVGMPAEYVMKVEQMFKDITVSEDLNQEFRQLRCRTKDSINIRVLNSAAWARPSEKVSVSVPVELEDFISEMEDFYRQKFSGRKLTWHHYMSNGSLTFVNSVGKFELDVTTFQMAVMFAWNLRPKGKISFENLRLATELPDSELRKTIWSLVSIPMTKRSLILCHPEVKSSADFTDETQFSINDEFALIRNGKVQKRGKVNLIGRLQLSTEKSQQVDNEAIVRLREFRIQEAIVCVTKARKSIGTVQLHHELIGILKNMFLPTKRMFKEQVEWLIERDYLRRDNKDLNLLVYVA
uniref:Cullin-5 n=1 Tax=Strigamia maritima TaxID=126957 RepID=T1IRX8_STRMM